MKTHFAKKLFSLALALVMVLSLLPTAVFAAEGEAVASVTTAEGKQNYTTLPDAVAAATLAENATVTLLVDISLASTIEVKSGKFTIDLNGKVWTADNTALVLKNTDVLLTDNSVEGTGKLVSKNNPVIRMGNGAKLEIAGGTFEVLSGFFVVETGNSGQTMDSEFILSGGKLINSEWAVIGADCKTVLIKGGEMEDLGDNINYQSGLIDLSQHPDPTGIAFYPTTLKIRTTEAVRIKLPTGYCVYEQSSKEILPIQDGCTYEIGKAPADVGAFCFCETKCTEGDIDGRCPVCCAGVSVCAAEEVAAEQGNITLYFNNVSQWGKPYAYYWGGKTIAPWPGVAMTDEGNGIWSVAVPADAVNIDFNDSCGKCADLAIPTDGQNYYDNGIWTTYDSNACKHSFFYDCSTACCVCYLENVREASHSLVYVEAKDPVDCQNPGNIEYWYCEYCGETYSDAEGLSPMNPWYISITVDCTRPEDAADCENVFCTVCGEEVYGYGEHDLGENAACQGGTCSKCGEEVVGYGCQNYDGPACLPGYCYYCGEAMAPVDHENGAWAPCLVGECAYGCGKRYEPTADHIDEDSNGQCDTCYSCVGGHTFGDDRSPCEGGFCIMCWDNIAPQHNEEIIPGKPKTCTEAGLTDGVKCADCGKVLTAQEEIPAAHSFLYDCATTCVVCFEENVREASHSLVHVEGKEPVDCQTPGNVEYWYCEYCDETYSDAEGLSPLNPWFISITVDCTRPEDAADCENVLCTVCGEEVYGYGEHDLGENAACQGGTCSKCGEEIVGYGCQNYDGPACLPGNCYYCGEAVEPVDHENGAWAPCLVGECAYGCGKLYEPTADHVDEGGNDRCDVCYSCVGRHDLGEGIDLCEGGFCHICYVYVEAGHFYEYDCSAVCAGCGEVTRPEASHSLVDGVCVNCGYVYNQKNDINRDGNVDNDDVVTLLWYTLFPAHNTESVDLDLNVDGKGDNNDVLALMWHTLFPEENPL